MNQSLRVTPALEAGVVDNVRTDDVHYIVGLYQKYLSVIAVPFLWL